MLRWIPIALLAALPAANAWGELGHRTVAYLAETQFTEITTNMVNSILSDDIANGKDISDAAVWADEVKITPAYNWSKGLHFTGGGPTDVLSCGVTVCAVNACVIKAIANVTDILAKPSKSRDLDVEALKFLIHFFGDIHQPLHANNYKRGANDLYVRFDNTTELQGQPLRLHGVWDDFMPRKWNGLDFLEDNPPLEKSTAKLWAARLDHESQQSDEFRIHEECVDPSRSTTCPQVWAQESNDLVCPTVFRGNLTWVQTNDLFRSEYYKEAAPVMETRIQQAGNRLAAWLNAVSVARSPGAVPLTGIDEL